MYSGLFSCLVFTNGKHGGTLPKRKMNRNFKVFDEEPDIDEIDDKGLYVRASSIGWAG